jgi:type IV pilus assembly protein PilW
MVELLVALVIGSLLIVGAVFVYSQSRTTHALSETVARLQENARFALAVMEPDIQLAGNYGYGNQPSDIRYSDGTFVADMQQGKDKNGNAYPKFTKGPASGGQHECGTNFSFDLIATVQAVEKGFGLDCAAFGAGAAADSDTLIIRRASPTTFAANAEKLQLVANRLSPFSQVMFSAATSPVTLKTDFVDVRDIMTSVYYISQDSDARAGFPSLRRKSLQIDTTVLKDNKLHMVDEEIMAGVEDLQVQLGIDMGADTDGDGVRDDTDDNGVADVVNGQVTRYVNPNDTASAKKGQIVAVRIWLRLRADNGEVGYSNTTTYDQGTSTFVANDNIRRIVATRTFFLRNTRALKGT